MSESNDKRNATQRIEDLEKVTTVIYQSLQQVIGAISSMGNVGSDMALVRDSIRLLNKKSEAIIQAAAPETGITADSVSALIVKMNVNDLKAQAEEYLKNGNIAVVDAVVENGFLVCEEINSEGAVVNPRVQFRLDSQEKKTQEALLGKKAGDQVFFGENRFDVKILEVYQLTTPKTAEETAAEAPATETAPETAASEAAVTQAAPEASSTLDPLPPESPVVQFVPSGEILTASGT